MAVERAATVLETRYSDVRRAVLLRIIHKTTAWGLAATFALLAHAPGPARAASEDETAAAANIFVSKDTIAVFLLPSTQDAGDPAANQVRSVARTALAHVKECLGKVDTEYVLVFAKRIVVNSAGRIDTFSIGDPAPNIAALLARPGSNTRVIYLTGPESLAQTLAFAVQEYFGRRC